MSEWKNLGDDSKNASYFYLWVIIGLAALAGAIFFGIYFFGGVQSSTADYRGRVGQQEQTQGDPNFRIQSYQYFYNTCNSVITAEQQMLITQQEPDFNTPGSISRQNYQAQSAERVRLIGEYNSRAAQTGTVGDYRSNNLPYRLDPNRNPTTCGAY